MESLSDFHQSFISFFEQFDNVLMETRTKSGNVQSLLDLDFVPQNTEIAFSLNPQWLLMSMSADLLRLKSRISAIKKLASKMMEGGT
jgi:hypothetical protein